jgi:hypothetical protein
MFELADNPNPASMRRAVGQPLIIALLLLLAPRISAHPTEAAFRTPPAEAGTWVYWWWLNGHVSRDGIVRDLDVMKQQGISGALVFHAGTGWTPRTTTFMSSGWRSLFRYAVQEAARRKITLTLNVCDGWNAGGPWVDARHAARQLHTDVIDVVGPRRIDRTLPAIPSDRQYARELFVLAWRCSSAGSCESDSMVDLSAAVRSGRLSWNAPTGRWKIVRFASYVSRRAYTKVTGGPAYLEIDPLSREAVELHFDNTVAVLVEELGSLVGTTFTHVHIDSGELGNPDWTPQLLTRFRQLRSYDARPYLGAKAGLVIDSAARTQRFLEDYRRTVSDLWHDAYQRYFAQLAARAGLKIHPEAAGFQKPPVDALRVLGASDIPMGEFWSRRPDDNGPRINQIDEQELRAHDSIKNASSAAQAYGRSIVQAEAFTVIRPDNYSVELFDLKDVGDRAYCQGMNRPLLTLFVHQPENDRVPGYTWPGVGTTFTRFDRWWRMGGAWVRYLNRCNYMHQQGSPVADFLYLQPEQTPVFVPAKWAMDPPLPPGVDVDTINSEVLIDRLTANPQGRLALPGGSSYRYLVLWQGGPWRRDRSAASSPSGSGRPLALSPETLTAIKSLVEAGATLVGPPPSRAFGLADASSRDTTIAQLSAQLWGAAPAESGLRQIGKGRVIWGTSLTELMRRDGLRADLEIAEDAATRRLEASTLHGMVHPSTFDWIHRRVQTDGGSEAIDVYFIANLKNASAGGVFTFRVSDRQPERWDPISGGTRAIAGFRREADGRISLPLSFAPRESVFIVFRRASTTPSTAADPTAIAATTVTGPWEVAFDPAWGGPSQTTFQALVDWSRHGSASIRGYSGMATYRRELVLSQAAAPHQRLVLDLGELYSVARVKLNDQGLGTRFTAPWRFDITDVAREGSNTLEVQVANTWRNRVAADSALPQAQRLSYTNVLDDHAGTFHLHTLAERIAALRTPNPAGLIGPVTVATVGVAPPGVIFSDTFTASRGRSTSLDDNLHWRTNGAVDVSGYLSGRTTNRGAAAPLPAGSTQLSGGGLLLSGDATVGQSMVWAGPDHDFSASLPQRYWIRFRLLVDGSAREIDWVAINLGEAAGKRGAWVLDETAGISLLFRANGQWVVLGPGKELSGTTEGAGPGGQREVEIEVDERTDPTSFALSIDGDHVGTFRARTQLSTENHISFAGWIGGNVAAGQVIRHVVDDFAIVDPSPPRPVDAGVSDGASAGDGGASDATSTFDAGIASDARPGPRDGRSSAGGCSCSSRGGQLSGGRLVLLLLGLIACVRRR